MTIGCGLTGIAGRRSMITRLGGGGSCFPFFKIRIQSILYFRDIEIEILLIIYFFLKLCNRKKVLNFIISKKNPKCVEFTFKYDEFFVQENFVTIRDISHIILNFINHCCYIRII